MKLHKDIIPEPHFEQARRIVESWPAWKRNIGYQLEPNVIQRKDGKMIDRTHYKVRTFAVEDIKSGVWDEMLSGNARMVLYIDHASLLEKACEEVLQTERERCRKLVRLLRLCKEAEIHDDMCDSIRFGDPKPCSCLVDKIKEAIADIEIEKKENQNVI